jgi:hypothetical protein
MVNQLLELPPELITQILAFLPVRTLLKFSETSHYARFLANSNLHTLNLGIPAIRDRSLIKDTSDKIHVRIKGAFNYDYTTLLNFHNALIQSILLRHADTLRTLDLSLWTLTQPIAETIAELSALRSLSIRVEEDIFARAVPRNCMAWERREQDKAWTVLARTATWKDRLRVLRLENAELTTEQLAALLCQSRWCGALQLSRCRFIGKELWRFLGRDWAGRSCLQRLVLDETGGVLDEKAFEAIVTLSGLRVSNNEELDV